MKINIVSELKNEFDVTTKALKKIAKVTAVSRMLPWMRYINGKLAPFSVTYQP